MNIVRDLNDDGRHEAVSDTVLAGMDAETAEAKGLPNEAFTDPAFLELERKHLFARPGSLPDRAARSPNPARSSAWRLPGVICS